MAVSSRSVPDRFFMKTIRSLFLVLGALFGAGAFAASPTFDTVTATTVTASTTLNAPSSFTLAIGKITGLFESNLEPGVNDEL